MTLILSNTKKSFPLTVRARYATVLALALMLCGAWAQSEPAANGPTLQEISSSSLPGGKVQIKLRHSAPPSAPLSFTIDNPARIVLDFADTAHSLAKSSQTIGLGAVRSVNVASAKGRTRVVLNLDQLVPYETRAEGNDIYLTLDASGGEAMASAARAAAPTTATAKHSLSNIDFRRGEKGEARIIVSLSHPATSVDVHQEGGQIIADFLNTSVPENLERRLDVVDFATPVRIVETARHGNNTRMVITAQGEYEHLAYHAANVFTIEVKPVTKAELDVAGKKKVGYSGEKLSLNFQDIPVRSVLQLIADFTGQNLVVNDQVTGNVTLRLQNVPWDQALDIILKNNGLDMRQTGNVMEVMTREDIVAHGKHAQQMSGIAPMRSESIRVNYAKATELAKLIDSILSQTAPGGDDKEKQTMRRGRVVADDNTNTLLVQDTEDKLAEIRKLVSVLDVPQRQVLIEARIVIANNNFSKDLGVKFGVSRLTTISGDPLAIGGSLGAGTGTAVTGTIPLVADRLNVNLPILKAPSIALALAKLPFGTLLDLELSALQAENRGEMISNPRVVTANQKEATISDGVAIPVVTQGGKDEPATTTFKVAALSLKVKPMITPDNRIIMDIAVTRDVPGQGGNIDVRAVTTQVMVANGETVVLGGTYTTMARTISERVPFFGDLPYIGFLFKKTTKQDDKSELLIFVTPKILDQTIGLAQ